MGFPGSSTNLSNKLISSSETLFRGVSIIIMPVFSNLISLLDKTVDSTRTWVQIGPDLPVILL
jgi:hypothetical protein